MQTQSIHQILNSLSLEQRIELSHFLKDESFKEIPSLFISSDVQAPQTVFSWEGLSERYQPEILLGQGGMAEVFRAFDRVLERNVALKVLRGDRSGANQAFFEEARSTARLIHPAIVPVYDAGILQDGRPWFTMREVQGQTLAQVIRDVHAASSEERWEVTQNGWSFPRLLRAFLTVCEAVGYAHAQQVLHRDLKPQNVMVGSHGEVLVMDWGLAQLTSRSTSLGHIVGTPAYMSPEQARGEGLDFHADVYSLGAILYHICTDHPPIQGESLTELIQKARRGEILPLKDHRVPEELKDLCHRALSFEADRRPLNASRLARDIQSYLEGAQKRERALLLVKEGWEKLENSKKAAHEAQQLEVLARQVLSTGKGWEPAERKVEGWEKEDQARQLREKQEQLAQEAEALWEAALTHDPNASEAHTALLGQALSLHREGAGGRRVEQQMRVHLEALSESHPARQEAEHYLKGEGFLTLLSDPPGAEVSIFRYLPQHRRLIESPLGSLGKTPLRAVPLAPGSYLLKIRLEGRAEVLYPVFIRRLEHWDGVAPGESEATPIYLPIKIPSDECYVPAGWACFGGPVGGAAICLPPHRAWTDGFFIQRFPVRNRDYLDFLNNLLQNGQKELAFQCQPQNHAGAEVHSPIYGLQQDQFILQPDPEGDIWDPDWPVVMISHPAARHYAAWMAHNHNLPWRLPREHEREKASRGVDGRIHPWGDGFDPSFCWMRETQAGRLMIGKADGMPLDISLYGVQGMAGNTLDWVADAFAEQVPSGTLLPLTEGRSYVAKGGSWSYRANSCASYARWQVPLYQRRFDVGIRLVKGLNAG